MPIALFSTKGMFFALNDSNALSFYGCPPQTGSRGNKLAIDIAPTARARIVPGNTSWWDMIRIAIPIYQGRVSPVLDTCRRLLLIEFDPKKKLLRQEFFLDRLSLYERFNLIKKAKIDVIICCAVSDVLYKLIQTAGLKLISGIIGDVDLVLEAFFSNALNAPRFQMPGNRKARAKMPKQSKGGH